jgi:hypothetical protein
MSDEQEKAGGFKVQDKRRFDASGNAREGAPEKEQPKPIKQSAAPNTESQEPINFSSFVLSLATQALMQLGAIKPPPGVQVDIDHNAAKQTIAVIEMLELKCNGNLDANEAGLIKEVLHNLRLNFIKV